jgi:hypothetical protein
VLPEELPRAGRGVRHVGNKESKGPATQGLLMRRRGLEPPPGYPGPGPQPGNSTVISESRQIVRIVRWRGRYGRIGRSGCCHGCCHEPSHANESGAWRREPRQRDGPRAARGGTGRSLARRRSLPSCLDTCRQRVAAALPRMQERHGLRSRSGGRLQLVAAVAECRQRARAAASGLISMKAGPFGPRFTPLRPPGCGCGASSGCGWP